MSAVEVCVGEDKSWKTILIYRAGEGISLERRDLSGRPVERMDISLAELHGLGPAAADLIAALSNADATPADEATHSRRGSTGSSELGNSPSSLDRGSQK